MGFKKAWLLVLGLAVSILLVSACSVPEVLPPPATATPASQYLEKPQPALIKGVLVPQPASVVMEEQNPIPVPQTNEQVEQSTPVPQPPSVCATVVNTDLLNVRSSPVVGSDDNKVGVVQQGNVFTIIGNNSDRTWYQVEIPQIAGDTWLYNSYIEEGPCQ